MSERTPHLFWPEIALVGISEIPPVIPTLRIQTKLSVLVAANTSRTWVQIGPHTAAIAHIFNLERCDLFSGPVNRHFLIADIRVTGALIEAGF